MSVKIKLINIAKDVTRKHHVSGDISRVALNKLEGMIFLELSLGKISGESKVSIEDISEQLQDELYSVLTKIENELNEIKKENL